MSDVLFTVITPVYNNTKYLNRCAESVLSQDFINFEYIIVDDGSTDGTKELCDEIAKTDSRIKVIHQENQWIYASFNNGIKAATGEYIYIVNSDDMLIEGTLSKLSEIINSYMPDVIWTTVQGNTCDRDGNILKKDISGLANSMYGRDVFIESNEELRKYWKDLYHYGFTLNQANAYRRELMLNNPFRNDVFAADSLFNISIVDEINSSYILNEPVYDFFIYQSEEMNTSVGKAYGYESKMFREILSGHTALIEKWNCPKEDRIYFEQLEISTVINCTQLLNHPKLNYSGNEKIRVMLTDYFCEDFFKEVKDINCFERIDALVTKEIMGTVIKKQLSESDEYYFFDRFINLIAKQDKTESEINEIIYALNNKLNPCHFGKSIAQKMMPGLFS